MVRLAQGTVCRLCLALCRRLLSVPLATFEGLNHAAVLAVLTEDIVIVANALVGIPLLGINLPIVIVGFAYVGWLSPGVLAAGLVFAALAIAVYQATALGGMRRLALARTGQDTLVAHFRTLIAGFRELKQHQGRREAFFSHGLRPTALMVRDQNASGLTLFAVAGSWGQAAFFGFIGILLFAFSGAHALGSEVLGGVVLVVLYIMTPLDVILTWLPLLGRARISLRRIEALGLSLAEAAGNDLDLPAVPPDPPGFAREIALEGVTFAYGRDEFVLGPLDLTLRAGEIVFLAGGNGSGKTTMVKLLAGSTLPPPGQSASTAGRSGPRRWKPTASSSRSSSSTATCSRRSGGSTSRGLTRRPPRCSSGSGSTTGSESSRERSRQSTCPRASGSGWRC